MLLSIFLLDIWGRVGYIDMMRLGRLFILSMLTYHVIYTCCAWILKNNLDNMCSILGMEAEENDFRGICPFYNELQCFLVHFLDFQNIFDCFLQNMVNFRGLGHLCLTKIPFSVWMESVNRISFIDKKGNFICISIKNLKVDFTLSSIIIEDSIFFNLSQIMLIDFIGRGWLRWRIKLWESF